MSEIEREIHELMERGATGRRAPSEPARLRADLDVHARSAEAARDRLDALDPPSSLRVLQRVDRLLAQAQDQIGRHLTTMATKAARPIAYKAGLDLFSDIERVRGQIPGSVRRAGGR